MTVHPTTTASGWAVILPGGNIDVATVSPTRRGAIVNWLWSSREVRVLNNWNDGFIDAVWAKEAIPLSAFVMPVTITASGVPT